MIIKIDIESGTARCLYTDDIPLTDLGSVKMTRASHVEWDDGKQTWEVLEPKTLSVLMGGFKTRKDALAWEVSWAERNIVSNN